MRVRGPQEVTNGSFAWDQTLAWARTHFGRSLLFLGDASEALSRHARFWSWIENNAVRGLAVRFQGFHLPVVSSAAENADICGALIEVASASAEALLVTHEEQPLPAQREAEPATYEPWLDAMCSRIPIHSGVCSIHDTGELARFYATQGVHYWHPDMLKFGHCFGVRGSCGSLVSAGGVNFVLSDRSYAQIGALVTAEHARRHSYATAVLTAVRDSLARAGVDRCGLFADASDPTLPRFYAMRGFRVRGRLRFSRLFT